MTVEKKLFEFDNKLKNIDVMLTLLESKLHSLPEDITRTYPELTHISINDVNPEILILNYNYNPASENQINNNHSQGNKETNIKQEENKYKGIREKSFINQEESIKEEPLETETEPTPQEKLEKFLEENEDVKVYHNMLK